ncbi:peptide chain release factor N(5)-glutamine methyltransferase [Nitrosomonas supralitoralis]|uniref:Release factor glutamine methyltransferase n=2 Tax=Nitrosomonas supralitoralis TaxID=2116706 RepID=A0A2P7NV54_9PROT|nr:peptide chain release factor N(5)-glutamine methyltransferase [Nitrosomonas supralitoralis]
MQPVTISQALDHANTLIDRIDAILLLQQVLVVSHAFLLTYPDQILTAQQFNQFSNLVQQRIEGVPVAYLIGERAFFDLTFKVTEAVLIPRPETELLVEWALKLLSPNKFCKILDLGTGSGALGISIASLRPQSQVIAVDLSPDAINVCRRNVENLKVTNLNAICGNWFDELLGQKFDLIVSNPPYVSEDDPHLQQGDLRFEPKMALSAGEHGMSCITHIINEAPSHLSNDGWLLLEHGYDQAETCRQLLRDKDFSNICSYPDLAGIMRVSGGQLNLSK